MTEEKRKRGRPKGSGKKGIPEKIIDPDEIQRKIKEVKEKFKGMPRLLGKTKKAVVDEKQQEFNKDLKEKGFAETPNKKILVTDANKFDPLPDNYFSMSRTDKLKWLTEHR